MGMMEHWVKILIIPLRVSESPFLRVFLNERE